MQRTKIVAALPLPAVRRVTVYLTAAAVLIAPVATATSAEAARVKPTSVSISTSSAVLVGKAIVVTGKATGKRRPVVLQYRTLRGWAKIKKARTVRTGAYRFSVGTHGTGTLALRVLAPKVKGRTVGLSATRNVTVRRTTTAPTPGTPQGNAKDWKALEPGLRWNPCEVINYRVNLTRAPVNARKNIDRAFALIHHASGLNFRYAGTTTKVPFADGDQFEDGTIIVAWSTPARVPSLAGGNTGIGGAGWSTYTENGVTSPKKYVYGGTTLDSTDSAGLADGFGRGHTEGHLLLHELGHTVGLTHVSAREQVMSPSMNSQSYAQYGAGDLAGLRAMGSAQGCLD